MELNYDSSSSSPREDELNEYLLMDFIEENRELQAVKDAIRYFVNSTAERDRSHGLLANYFCNQPLYDERQFRHRFRMRKHVFICIVDTLSVHERFFQQHPDACKRQGVTALQKCTAAIRMLPYGCAADQIDEYLKLPLTFGSRHLTISKVYAEKGKIETFLLEGKSRTATVILKVVASRDLLIWHAFFGTPGSCNDINVLQHSPSFDTILNGRAPQVQFNVNENTYNKGLFTQNQESARKNVERAFGVLQARFAIIQKPALAWSATMLWKIMMACIIIHNMIVEDERNTYTNYKDPQEFSQEQSENVPGSSSGNAITFSVTPGRYDEHNFVTLLATREEIRDRQAHFSLKNDLIDHLWHKFESSYSD
ncbi:uncharacterized protein LOC130808561 [Amaranthus tricolor]|uniref:uncharacterized protein LOC130808561 n=1 Tax=Amaranthus tricolor TaxID=29722 RepID=UPI00258A2730|nr:uncharacterized protein LOC130808561 [Amaranthus tricolor]